MALLFVAGFAVFAFFFHPLVYLSGGREGPGRTLAVLLYAATPVLLGFWALEAGWLYNIFLLNILIPLLFGWAVVIAAAGLRELHGLSVLRAALPFFLMVIVVFLLFLVFVVLTWVISPNPCGGCSKISAVTAACSGEQINVTYMGGQDAGMLVNVTVYETDRTRARVMGGPEGILPVGSVLVLDGPFHTPANVIALAHYTDGSEQVVLDTRMDCGSGPKLTRTPDGAPPRAGTSAGTTPATTPVQPAGTGTPAGTPVTTTAPATPGAAPAPAPAAVTNLTKGLLVWYDFEDDFAAAGRVADRSGKGRDGTITGTVQAGPGIAGTKGISFTGNGYLLARDNPAWGRTNVTFSFWFRTADPTQNYKFASAAEWHGGPGSGWTMATHRPEFWADDGPDDLLVPAQPDTDNGFVPGAWTHEAVVYNGATMKEYTNGTLINTWQARGTPMSRGVPMAVGGWPQFAGYNYRGSMDDFRIYERTLSPQEVAQLYQAGRG